VGRGSRGGGVVGVGKQGLLPARIQSHPMWPRCEVVASWPALCSHTLDAPLTEPA